MPRGYQPSLALGCCCDVVCRPTALSGAGSIILEMTTILKIWFTIVMQQHYNGD